MFGCCSLAPVFSAVEVVYYEPPQNPLIHLFQKTNNERVAEYENLNREIPRKTTHISDSFSATDCFGNSMILSQTPGEGCLDDYFQLLYDRVEAVMLLTQDEDYKNRPQLCAYHKFDQLDCSRFSIKVIWLGSDPIDTYRLEITPKEPPRPTKYVVQYHYKSWKDGHGLVPHQLAKLTRLLLQINKPFIQCIGGKGRTGTLATVIAVYRKIINGDRSLDIIPNTLSELRKEREGCVRSLSQYSSIYDTLEVLLREDNLLPN